MGFADEWGHLRQFLITTIISTEGSSSQSDISDRRAIGGRPRLCLAQGKIAEIEAFAQHDFDQVDGGMPVGIEANEAFGQTRLFSGVSC